MIIVQLKGGFGNQLFQYAAGLSLSKHHQVRVKVDVDELRQPDEEIGTLRKYELCNIIAPPAIATSDEIAALTKRRVFTNYLQKTLPSYQRIIYKEKQPTFDEHFFEAGNNIYLIGYRQSEKYFLPVAHEVFTSFQLNPALTSNVSDLGNTIRNLESVSIHIRRGDYANTSLANYHGIASQTFYQQAIDKITSTLTNPVFFIFSDNISWVKQNLELDANVVFVSGNTTQNHYEDFYLMTQCRHNIIANSTFSWWAAWLNPSPDKIVIAPKKWYNQAKLDTSDLIPQAWIRL